MAVNFATAPPILNPASSVPYSTYTGGQPTPESSVSGTPNSSSSQSSPRNDAPTTHAAPNNVPNFGFHSRQLRPPKMPLYVPAVLRPTEPPTSHRSTRSTTSAGRASRPLTPPKSSRSSLDGKEESSIDEVAARGFVVGLPFAEGISRVVTDEWSPDRLDDVTGPPSRAHWKPDAYRASCNADTCQQQFSFLTRRHHCRRCGDIFCSSHSTATVPLDQYARFHPEGIHERACVSCYNDFRLWDEKMNKRLSRASTKNASSIIIHGDNSGSTTPLANSSGETDSDGNVVAGSDEPTDGPKPGDGKGRRSGEIVVGSLSGDWNWSTF